MQTTVYKNASIVTGLSVAERALGFLYRIVLSRLIGAEGLGLYQVALSLFALFSTLATGGIPITVSRMIAKSKAEKDEAGEKSVVSAGLSVSLLIALPLCFLLGVFGGKLTFLFSDERSFHVFRILLLGLSFSGVYAVIRGYFWGTKQFFVASILEMIEEIAMVLGGVLLLRGITSPVQGAERAAWAMCLADLLSCLVAVVCFFVLGGGLIQPKKSIKPLFNASLPITSVRASGSLVNSAVAVLLPAMLIKSGASAMEATKLFGIVTGMVVPVLFIPTTLIGSLSLVLVPELSEDFYQKNVERLKNNLRRGLRFSFLVACALIPFFSVLGEELGALAFSNPVAGSMISKSCWILLPMSLTMISSSMLNSIGFEKQTFAFFFCGAAVLLLSILLLPAVCGAYAYVIGLGGSYIVTAACNLIFLHKKCPIFTKRGGQVSIQATFLPLIAVLPISLLGQLLLSICRRYFSSALAMLCTGGTMALATLFFYVLLKILPFGKKRAV